MRKETGNSPWDNESERCRMAERFVVGDIIKMKKPHPCGSHEWEVLRVGADFRLKCTGCGHQIMVPRKLVEKNTREIKKPEKKTGMTK